MQAKQLVFTCALKLPQGTHMLQKHTKGNTHLASDDFFFHQLQQTEASEVKQIGPNMLKFVSTLVMRLHLLLLNMQNIISNIMFSIKEAYALFGYGNDIQT